ncbi:cyclic nucleotide-binding domain-containing protein [Roseicyclus persicicus]|uniref:Cyclic nucleotide-binding domain-containing protein n=1 Tax=Roseicyclus persicicus TaxID=2650661 RepID=A0A7X6GYH0_9RHOB|nr:cyclic nucleotide-binding domain-containing protein [Roseibacterium persicicum]NKX43462.1 cyclic nucleotide-binding domain-containing protein [Roseibacterium persicicum]
MPPVLFEIAGILGVILYLSAYGSLQLGFLRGHGYPYAFLNLGASSMMLVSLTQSFNPFAAVIESCWIAFSLIGIARLFILNRGLRLTPEEREFVAAKLRGIEPILARALVAAGRWEDAAPGTVLMAEGQAVPALVWLRDGQARVTVGGREVATLGPGNLVGEFGAPGGHPAIATVTLTAPARLFAVDSAALQALMRRKPGIRVALDAAIGAEARAKFIASNARAAAV